MSNALVASQPYVTVPDIESQSSAVTVSLKRRVARFDVIAEGITISRVNITNAAPTGRILDSNDAVAAPGAGGLTYSITGTSLANTGKSFYLYPTTLGAGSTGTVITVEAAGKTYSIPLAASQTVEANKLYRIVVSQSSTSTDLNFKLEVADWNDSGSLPTFEEGSVSAGFNPVATASPGVSIGEDNYSVDYSDATTDASAQIYYVSATNAKPTLGTVEALNGTHADAISVSISDPTPVSYASGYMSTITISLPKTTVPVDLKVNLTGTTSDTRAITVKSVPAYTDTRYPTDKPYKPVLKAGRYWAPLNVGATTLTLPPDGKFPNTAYTGLEFQWGRNVGFRMEDYATVAANTVTGPVSLADAEGQYADRFIKTANVDWLTPSDNTLWSGYKAQGPCPAGWRVPTSAENLRLLQNQVVSNVVPATGDTPNVARAVWLAGDNADERLYLPATGYVDLTSASVMATREIGTFASYWTSTTYSANNVSFCLIKTLGTGKDTNTRNVAKSWALPVRCIQL
jgi:uncharacterized protein (TIGR02145 family)